MWPLLLAKVTVFFGGKGKVNPMHLGSSYTGIKIREEVMENLIRTGDRVNGRKAESDSKH